MQDTEEACGGAGVARCGHSTCVGVHYEGRERLRPGRTVPGVSVLHRGTADQAEALRVWSPVGVLAARGVLGLWEARWCQ